MKIEIEDFHEYIIHDILGHIEGVTSKKMFGGYGFYLNGLIFAIITSDTELRFKVDDSNRKQYEDLGSTPFVYTGHKNRKPVTMNYYLVPEEVLEDRDKIRDWANQSADINLNK